MFDSPEEQNAELLELGLQLTQIVHKDVDVYMDSAPKEDTIYVHFEIFVDGSLAAIVEGTTKDSLKIVRGTLSDKVFDALKQFVKENA